jgi:5-methyltetrahydropteroyltriglutamate--homocysteine methyltransferase
MPPFRAEHIGSLLRPPGLVEGNEDEEIARVIRWQESLGLKVVTDGEFRRESWRLGFVAKVEGLARADAIGEVDVQRDAAGSAGRVGSAPVAVGKLRRTRPIVADEVAFALRHATSMVKATLPAPSYLHYPRGRACVDPRVLCDEALRAAVRARGDDPDALVELYIGLVNRVARECPDGMTLGVHMCRGNALGRWIGSGGYEAIAERTFGSLEVDAYFLEYDTERAGGFEPLRFMPKSKQVVLGLVSTKTPALEEKKLLLSRIAQAARHVPLENLSLSPQCGFASHRKGTVLTFADQEAKLRLVVETAAEVWGET